MRTIKQLPEGTPRETDLVKFPDSTIVNETDVNYGTPVVREVYGDIITNLYKLLRLAKISSTGIEDNELNGYQIVDALKKLSNELNDVEQQLNLNGTIFSIGLDLSILPNKYVCFCRAAETMMDSVTYTFKGTGPEEYQFNPSNKFKGGDEVLLIIDTGSVRAYNINSLSEGDNLSEVFTPFGAPLAYSDETKVYYQSEGVLFSDKPESYDLQSMIRLALSDGTLIIYEMLLISGHVYCLVFSPSTLIYKIYRFALDDFNNPLAVSITGPSFPSGANIEDFKPNIYTDGVNMFITNNTGNSINDFEVNSYQINAVSGELSYSSTINLNPAFLKTTNTIVKESMLYTFIGGSLIKHNLGNGVLTQLGSYPTFIGLLFQMKSGVYYSNGEVAKRWVLA